MYRKDMTERDIRPYYMDKYLKYYGPHFNRQLCEFAVSKMYKRNENGEKIAIKLMPKEEVEELLKTHNIKIKATDILHDCVFVAHMGKADFYKSSIEDLEHLAKYIKDVIDDPDGYEGMPFSRWYTDMCKKGIPIDWEAMI